MPRLVRVLATISPPEVLLKAGRIHSTTSERFSYAVETRNVRLLRLLPPCKISYEAAKKSAEPYSKIVGELPEMCRSY